LEQGKTALLTGQNANGEWWQIAYPTEQERGWVAAQFTTVNGATISVAIVEIPTPAQSETARPTAAPIATTVPIAVELIAFQSTMDSPTFDIYTIKPDGTELRRLTDAPGNDQFPSWSPDAKRIVFTSDRDGQNEIYVMNLDGSNQQRLAPHSEEDLVPRWAHDGKSIAFFSTRDGKSIFVMNPDGSNVRKVLTNENISFEYEQFRLAWSPDDQMLAYTAGDPGDQTLYLYVINLDGTLIQRFSDLSAPEWKWFESFSPDGRYQLVQYYGNRPKEIFIADAHTKANQRKLADGGNGVWSPR
jgi:TolB protein